MFPLRPFDTTQGERRGHWKYRVFPFVLLVEAYNTSFSAACYILAGPSRDTTTTSFRPSGGCGKASRLDVFPLDEIPKDLELRIAGEQRGVRGYSERCGKTIGIGHRILGFYLHSVPEQVF